MKLRILIVFLFLSFNLTAQEDQLTPQQIQERMQQMFSPAMQDSIAGLIPDSLSDKIAKEYGLNIKKVMKDQMLNLSEKAQHIDMASMADSLKKTMASMASSEGSGQKKRRSYSLAKAMETPDTGPTLYDYALQKKAINSTVISEVKKARHILSQRKRSAVNINMQRPRGNSFSSIPKDYDYDNTTNPEDLPSYETLALTNPEAAAKEYEKYMDERKKDMLKSEAIEMEGLNRQAELSAVSWEQIKSVLPPQSAAIEFIRIKDKEVESMDETIYAAAIFRSEFEEPKMVTLGHTDKLSKLLAIGSGIGQEKLYTRGGTPLRSNMTPSQALYNMVWEEIDQMLVGIEKVYYAPDGLLHEVAFSALQDRNNKLISDKYELHQLGSTRTLIKGISEIYPPRERCWILAGGLSYYKYPGLPSISKSSSCNIVMDSMPASYSASHQSLPPSETIEELPGSLQEIEILAKMLDERGISFQKLTGSEVPEEYFKRLGGYFKSPSVLHLATHGFYIPSKIPLEGPKQSTRKRSKKGTMLSVFESIEDPLPQKDYLDRSGLYLSGAAKRKYSEQSFTSRDDGYWLTGEIAGQNLSETKLVVLSACNSGRGDTNMKEGVLGLQRAFKLAGVKKMIVSLWEISDAGTAVFMESFYSHWLSEKSAYQALRLAQEDMRKHPKYNTPYYWAGFVLLE